MFSWDGVFLIKVHLEWIDLTSKFRQDLTWHNGPSGLSIAILTKLLEIYRMGFLFILFGWEFPVPKPGWYHMNSFSHPKKRLPRGCGWTHHCRQTSRIWGLLLMEVRQINGTAWCWLWIWCEEILHPSAWSMLKQRCVWRGFPHTFPHGNMEIVIQFWRLNQVLKGKCEVYVLQFMCPSWSIYL